MLNEKGKKHNFISNMTTIVLYIYQMRASLVAQLVKNPPAMQETPVWFLGQEVPWRRNSYPLQYSWASLVVQTVKESACNMGDLGSIPGLGRSPGGGHGNSLQYSCLENPQGQRSLEGCSPWGGKESDSVQWLSLAQHSTRWIYLVLTTVGLPAAHGLFLVSGKVQGWGCTLLRCWSCSCGFSCGARALEHRLSCSAACGLFPAPE